MLVPELTVADPTTAEGVLQRFGFVPEDGLWRWGGQALRLVQGQPVGVKRGGHGRIDHLALAVPDIDAALAALMAAGLTLDADVTPDGPGFIPEFWQNGLRYVYLSGPEGARVELCERVTGGVTSLGHDHIGIPCAAVAGMQAFFEGQGARLVAAVDLARPEGMIPVRFLAFEGAMIELYQPPTGQDRPADGLWSRLLVQGLAVPLQGPEGLTLAPL